MSGSSDRARSPKQQGDPQSAGQSERRAPSGSDDLDGDVSRTGQSGQGGRSGTAGSPSRTGSSGASGGSTGGGSTSR